MDSAEATIAIVRGYSNHSWQAQQVEVRVKVMMDIRSGFLLESSLVVLKSVLKC